MTPHSEWIKLYPIHVLRDIAGKSREEVADYLLGALDAWIDGGDVSGYPAFADALKHVGKLSDRGVAAAKTRWGGHNASACNSMQADTNAPKSMQMDAYCLSVSSVSSGSGIPAAPIPAALPAMPLGALNETDPQPGWLYPERIRKYPDMLKAWHRWLVMREAIRKPVNKPEYVDVFIKQLERFGKTTDMAIRVLDQATMNQVPWFKEPELTTEELRNKIP